MRFALLLLPLFAACSHLRVERSEPAQTGGTLQRLEINSFVWGFIPGRRLPLESQLCPKSKIETLDFKMDSQDVWLTLLTLGIYVPHRVDVTCGKELAADR